MKERQKVYAYITHGTKLLVFEERGFPKGGVQVPGGTPETGECPEDAVLREATEETGLENLRFVKYLGDTWFDVSIYGIDEVHHRLFYHLKYDGEPFEKWSHIEKDPSIILHDTPDEIIFDLYWVDLRNEVPTLQKGFDAKLDVLFDSLNI